MIFQRWLPRADGDPFLRRIVTAGVPTVTVNLAPASAVGNQTPFSTQLDVDLNAAASVASASTTSVVVGVFAQLAVAIANASVANLSTSIAFTPTGIGGNSAAGNFTPAIISLITLAAAQVSTAATPFGISLASPLGAAPAAGIEGVFKPSLTLQIGSVAGTASEGLLGPTVLVSLASLAAVSAVTSAAVSLFIGLIDASGDSAAADIIAQGEVVEVALEAVQAIAQAVGLTVRITVTGAVLLTREEFEASGLDYDNWMIS